MSELEEYSKSNKKILELGKDKLERIEISLEYEKCKNSPYYFATKYLTINGKPFVTNLSEEEFNKFWNMAGIDILNQIKDKRYGK